MTTQPINGPSSSNPYLEALQWGGWHWTDPDAAPGDPVVIRYYVENYKSSPWASFERVALQKAFTSWSDVANISFVKVSSSASAQLVERLVPNSLLTGALGEHGTPESAATGPEYDGSLLLGANNRGYGYYNWEVWSKASLKPGGYDFITLVHELGHGLGLAHPHDDGGGSGSFPGVTGFNDADRGDFNLNQGIFTVMSYNDGWQTAPKSNRTPGDTVKYGYQAGPMAFDIAAIQDLYGANTTKNSGDTVYKLPSANKTGTFWSCIWDTGGTDTVVYSGSKTAKIDLNAATLDNTSTGGGVPSYAKGIYGGYTIAHGVVIENVIGGSGKDNIIGNSADNSLNGRKGNDTLNGGGGHDTLIGGAGSDNLIGGAGSDDFILDAPRTTTAIDRIFDFQAGIDTMVLDNALFAGIGAEGVLSAAVFVVGFSNMDADARIIYDGSVIYYDSNGSGIGGTTFVVQIGAGHALTAGDFLVV